MKRYRTFKVEIDPTDEQKQQIARFQGICRFVYNLYLHENQERWEAEKKLAEASGRKPHSTLMKPAKFYTWLKQDYIPASGKIWINDCPSKAVRQSINDANEAYRKFFKKQSGFPKFKKKGSNESMVYFCRNSLSQPVRSSRWYVQVPKLGRVHLKEKGRIPTYVPNEVEIVKGRIGQKNGRWYMSVYVEYEVDSVPSYRKDSDGIGIDLGIKELAVLSNKEVFANINKKRPMKRKLRKLKHLSRIYSRKLKAYRARKKKDPDNRPTRSNLNKAQKRLQAVQQKMNNTRNTYRRQTVARIMNLYPSYITMEDLNIAGMMKNRKLAHAISQMQWYAFRTDVQFQCAKRGIEFRLADRRYPSSKTCHQCGHVHKDLKLSDRTFVCPDCGYTEDRDLNAAHNLRDTAAYTVLDLQTTMF